MGLQVYINVGSMKQIQSSCVALGQTLLCFTTLFLEMTRKADLGVYCVRNPGAASPGRHSVPQEPRGELVNVSMAIHKEVGSWSRQRLGHSSPATRGNLCCCTPLLVSTLHLHSYGFPQISKEHSDPLGRLYPHC